MRSTLVCGVAVLLLAAPAAAGTIGVVLGVAPGKLVVRAQPTAVDGTASLTVRVADGRGSGQGWTLRLRTGAGLTVTAITATCAARSTCTLPTAIGNPERDDGPACGQQHRDGFDRSAPHRARERPDDGRLHDLLGL